MTDEGPLDMDPTILTLKAMDSTGFVADKRNLTAEC